MDKYTKMSEKISNKKNILHRKKNNTLLIKFKF
jgi:hypothetical protein